MELEKEKSDIQEELNELCIKSMHDHIKTVYKGEYVLSPSTNGIYNFKASLKDGVSLCAQINVAENPHLYAFKLEATKYDIKKVHKFINEYLPITPREGES